MSCDQTTTTQQQQVPPQSQPPPPSSNNIQHPVMGVSQDVISRLAHLANDHHHHHHGHNPAVGGGQHQDSSMMSATGISSSSSEHDNQETNAWSSDYSNSEDEFTHGGSGGGGEDGVLPGHKFVSLADYCAMGNSEVSMKETDIVELLKIGCAGWWFVKVIGTGLEGWAPAAYLEPINRKSSRGLRGARSQDKLNEH